MNKVQRIYMLAKAVLEEVEEREKELEEKYIATENVHNPDGSVPERIYCIEDDNLFERHNKGFADLPEMRQLQVEKNEAKADLDAAEKLMVDFAISLAPMRIKETLRRGVKDNASIREQLIDLAFRLDTSTIGQPLGGK